jgi:hypothetical protein
MKRCQVLIQEFKRQQVIPFHFVVETFRSPHRCAKVKTQNSKVKIERIYF